MKNNQFTFKTNINCQGCISKVKPVLDGNPNISKWSIDTENPNKLLTVESEILSEEDIISLIKKWDSLLSFTTRFS